MRDSALVTLLSLVPKRWASTAMGRLARTPSRWLAAAYVRAYDVDLSESEVPDAPTLDAVFTRRHRLGARPVDPDPEAVVSAVDGTVAWCGPTEGALPLGPAPLTIEDVAQARVAVRAAAVLYLSPRDVHRVHAPLAGRLTGFRYVPGQRWPVFPRAVRRIPRLFARNERLVLELETERGLVVVVMIGAFGVGRIRSPLFDVPERSAEGDLDAALSAGEELGVFHLGSTVLIGLPAAPRSWAVAPGDTVRTGRALARF